MASGAGKAGQSGGDAEGGAAHGILAGVAHVHAFDAALALLSLVLLATSLLAVAGTAVRPGSAEPRLPGAARWMGIGSTGGFLAAESVAYAMSQTHVVPPPLLLLAGAAVHFLCGTVAALLWRRGITSLLRLISGWCADGTRHGGVVKPRSHARAIFTMPRWPTLRLAGRAPPR
ncbi:hypothetical protein GCM10010199_58440 [Dactylosporangium roseum]